MEGAIIALMLFFGHQSAGPADVTTLASCKAETVKAVNGNYSYTSYDNCRKQ